MFFKLIMGGFNWKNEDWGVLSEADWEW
jgi:hypothetical protein